MNIAVGFDHAGVTLRGVVIEHLEAAGHRIIDHGTRGSESVDYPDFAHLVSRSVLSGEALFGILVCGTGVGMSIAANRHKGIRAALCTNAYLARMVRAHNNANVLCMGARVTGPGAAADIIDTFLRTEYEGGRHDRRLDKIESCE